MLLLGECPCFETEMAMHSGAKLYVIHSPFFPMQKVMKRQKEKFLVGMISFSNGAVESTRGKNKAVQNLLNGFVLSSLPKCLCDRSSASYLADRKV